MINIADEQLEEFQKSNIYTKSFNANGRRVGNVLTLTEVGYKELLSGVNTRNYSYLYTDNTDNDSDLKTRNYSYLVCSNLIDVNLSDADLNKAVLINADLTNAILTNAILTHAILQDVDLRYTKNIEQAVFDKDTDFSGAILTRSQKAAILKKNPEVDFAGAIIKEKNPKYEILCQIIDAICNLGNWIIEQFGKLSEYIVPSKLENIRVDGINNSIQHTFD